MDFKHGLETLLISVKSAKLNEFIPSQVLDMCILTDHKVVVRLTVLKSKVI